jgi:hypothetical protein
LFFGYRYVMSPGAGVEEWSRLARHCEDAMTDTRKVRMKIGDAEFEADVPQDQVQSMYDRFLTLLERRPPERENDPEKPVISHPKPPRAHLSEQKKDQLDREVDDAQMSRIFELRQDGIVALRVLPNGNDRDADALLLLLYGYRRLKNEEHILATQLLRAAKYSGLPSIDRIDRGFGPHLSRFVIRGGQRKGSTYTANNQGLAQAQEIAARMFE